MKYVNVKNNMVATVVEMNEKTKTVMLEYENGKTTNISTSTLKRWWKPIKEEDIDMEEKEVKKQEVKDALKKAVAEKKAEKEVETKDSDKCTDGTSYKEIGKEIVAQAAQKAKEVKDAKKSNKPSKKKVAGIPMEEAHKLIKTQVKKAGLEAVITDKNPKLVYVVVNGKKKVGVYTGGNKCVLKMPGEYVPKGYKADKVRNCPMSHTFDVSYDSMDKLGEILTKVNAMNKEDK